MKFNVQLNIKILINLIDNLTFTAASKNKIYIYEPLYTKDSIRIIKPLCESYDDRILLC